MDEKTIARMVFELLKDDYETFKDGGKSVFDWSEPLKQPIEPVE